MREGCDFYFFLKSICSTLHDHDQQLLNMAPIKRKDGPTNESFVRSRKISVNEDRPSKRARQDDNEKTKLEKPARTVPTTTIAKAREEDVAFPRGGASVLTPLEHKQIQIDATRDVLFEQGTAKAKALENDTVGGPDASNSTKKRKPKPKGKKSTNVPEVEEEKIRIEGLNYKVCDFLLVTS